MRIFITTLLVTVVAMTMLDARAIRADETSESTSRGSSPITVPPAEKVVCTYERVTGSHFRKRICRTESQIEADADAARRLLREIEDTSSNNVPPSPSP